MVAAPFLANISRFQRDYVVSYSDNRYTIHRAVFRIPRNLDGHQKFGAISRGLAVYGLTKLAVVLFALLLGLSVFWALIANVLATVGALLSLIIYPSRTTFRPLFVHTKLIVHLSSAHRTAAFGNTGPLEYGPLVPKNHRLRKGRDYRDYVAALNMAKVPTTAFSAVNVVILSALSMALAQRNKVAMQSCVRGTGRFLWITVLPACV